MAPHRTHHDARRGRPVPEPDGGWDDFATGDFDSGDDDEL